MKRGIVVATHPEDHSVDVVLTDGRRLVGVQVMTPNGSARTGTFDMPAVPERKGGSKWDVSRKNGQDQIAIVDFVDGVPVVVGFLYPQQSQMTFKDPKMRFARHQSDVAWSIDGDGNIQLDHPSGTYIRIGESADRVDMGGGNADGSLAPDRNTGRKVNIRIGLAGGTLDLTMSPDGGLTINAAQGVVIKSPQVTLDTPLVSVPNGDVVASGISLMEHVHTGVTSGPSKTGAPSS